jgi:hypothetical protein
MLEEMWRAIVTEYSAFGLSHEKDKFPALSTIGADVHHNWSAAKVLMSGRLPSVRLETRGGRGEAHHSYNVQALLNQKELKVKVMGN